MRNAWPILPESGPLNRLMVLIAAEVTPVRANR
jgi:hypothetical protein